MGPAKQSAQPTQCLSLWAWGGPRIGMPDKFSGNAEAAGPGHMLSEPLT